MEVLGVQYLMYILKEMQSTLVHGYQVMLKFFVALSRFVDFFCCFLVFLCVTKRNQREIVTEIVLHWENSLVLYY